MTTYNSCFYLDYLDKLGDEYNNTTDGYYSCFDLRY